jgi:uncharacterized protein
MYRKTTDQMIAEAAPMKSNLLITAIAFALAMPLFASNSYAQAGTATPPVRVIEVDGTGEARGTPDVATLNLAIETHAPTAEEAASRNGALAEKIIAALKAKLGDKGKISTGGYSLNPEYDQRPGHDQAKIVSYTAQNSITAETGALDLLGTLIDAAIGAGANRVNYLSFALKDDSKVRTEAIAIATRDAKAQADALAAALGVKLGQVVKATTISQSSPIPMQRGFAMAAEKMSTPVEPGEVTVPVTVSLTYYIE